MRNKILFAVIILLAIALRFSFLGSVPPSATLDEATIGWNAYSILHTGRDEYGYVIPMLLRAYDDYRPALYVYLVVPFVKLFGLQVLSVRLPSVILSVITVIMSFFLVKNMFVSFKKRNALALFVMFLLAISPWHVYISRLGHEVNLGLTLVVAAVLLFFVAVNKKMGWLFIASYATFALSFYSYQSEKVFTPLIVTALTLLFWRNLWALRKKVLLGFIIFAAVTLPIFFASLSPQSMLRLKATSVFDNNPKYQQSAQQLLLDKQKGNIVGEIVNNRRVITAEIFVQNYFVHFSPYWYFGNTGNEPFKAPNTGLMYLWEAPFLLLGILYFLFSKQIDKKIKTFVILWIFIDFLAPGITTQAPHAMRAYTLLPVPQILTSFGVLLVLGYLQKNYKGISMAFSVLFAVFVLQAFTQFIHNYFVVFPYQQSQSFQYALGEAMNYVAENNLDKQKIVISNKDNLYQSYMFYLFYSKYDPSKYFAAGGTKSGGFAQTHRIGNIEFRPINWEKDKFSHSLFIGNPADFPKSVIAQETFYYLDGKPGVVVVHN